jgi:17beta-estradiol 17-dehydrogenase / very-long-chain 3-oxoacyl-CoA reductase
MRGCGDKNPFCGGCRVVLRSNLKIIILDRRSVIQVPHNAPVEVPPNTTSNMTNTLILALAGLGAAVAIQFARSVFEFVSLHFLLPSRPLQAYHRPGSKSGAYALVTGGSAGIGFGIAQELVRQGFNIILHGYLPDEVAESAAALQKIRPSALVQTIVLDARTATPAEMKAAVASLEHLPLSVLVNNVGGNACALPPLRTLGTYTIEDVDNVLHQNAVFMARLTALLIPQLARRRAEALPGTELSLVLTLSSAGRVGLPWLTMYGACKAFNWALSVGLSREFAAEPTTAHVDALCIVPNEVKSQGNRQGVPAHEPTADAFGCNVVLKTDKALKFGWRWMAPHWRHQIELALLDRLPEFIRTTSVTDQVRVKKDAWDRYYAKNE